jgi:hypothetical protein
MPTVCGLSRAGRDLHQLIGRRRRLPHRVKQPITVVLFFVEVQLEEDEILRRPGVK